MIYYMDKTFCLDANVCANKEKCSRWLTQKEEERAKEIGLPIAMASLKDVCNFFEEEVTK